MQPQPKWASTNASKCSSKSEISISDGDVENALDTFQRILAIDPDHKGARSLIGLIYFNTSRYKTRHREYDRAR